MEKPWGIGLRMSIRLRRSLGREPSGAEVDRKIRRFKQGGPLDDVTAEDVMNAYNKGKEVG